MKRSDTHITIGSNRSLRSLGRAKARPLTKRYVQTHMKELIASLKVIGITPDGERIDIIAEIGKPFPVEGQEDIDEWACPVSLKPLYRRLHNAHGSGSLQTLCLATSLALNLLQGFIEKGGRLVHEDGTDFPLEAYSFGLAKGT